MEPSRLRRKKGKKAAQKTLISRMRPRSKEARELLNGESFMFAPHVWGISSCHPLTRMQAGSTVSESFLSRAPMESVLP